MKERNIINWYSKNCIITDQTRQTDQINFILLSIKMYLKSDEIKIDKKELHKSKKSVDANLVYTNKAVVSDKFTLEKAYKYYIGYKVGEFARPLWIILPQMSGFIKYFGGNIKQLSFLSEDEEIDIQYNKIWKKKINKT